MYCTFPCNFLSIKKHRSVSLIDKSGKRFRMIDWQVEKGSVWLIDKWKTVLYVWLTSGKQFCIIAWQVESSSVWLIDKWKAVPYDWLTSGQRFRMMIDKWKMIPNHCLTIAENDFESLPNKTYTLKYQWSKTSGCNDIGIRKYIGICDPCTALYFARNFEFYFFWNNLW